MALSCLLGRHRVVTRGVRNGRYEFGRCDRCRCDLLRAESDWRRVPKGFKVVWRPSTGDEALDTHAGAAAVARTVDLHGVTVVGERTFGAQRFALVVLNASDERSYAALADEVGTSGANAERMARAALKGPGLLRFARPAGPALPPSRSLTDIMSGDEDDDAFGWEGPIARKATRLIK